VATEMLFAPQERSGQDAAGIFGKSFGKQYAEFKQILKEMYPLVNKHRPWQIGVGRLVSTNKW